MLPDKRRCELIPLNKTPVMKLQVLGALNMEMENVTLGKTVMKRNINLIHAAMSKDDVQKLPAEMQSLCDGLPIYPVQVKPGIKLKNKTIDILFLQIVSEREYLRQVGKNDLFETGRTRMKRSWLPHDTKVHY